MSEQFDQGKNTQAGVLGVFQRATELNVVEVPNVNLGDGKPLAFKYIPFTVADWSVTEFAEYKGLPIFDEESSSTELEDWTLEQQMTFSKYLAAICKHGCREIRDVDGQNKSIWRKISWVDDGQDPVTRGDKIFMSISHMSSVGAVIPVGTAIMADANYGGKISPYVEKGFQDRNLHPVRTDGEVPEDATSRVPDKQA